MSESALPPPVMFYNCTERIYESVPASIVLHRIKAAIEAAMASKSELRSMNEVEIAESRRKYGDCLCIVGDFVIYHRNLFG